MELIVNLLNRIRDDYGVYIGQKSVSRLATFISGYDCALIDVMGHYTLFGATFQKFVEKKYSLDMCTKHWSNILLSQFSEEEAFDKFFELWEEMKNQVVDPYEKIRDFCIFDHISYEGTEYYVLAEGVKVPSVYEFSVENEVDVVLVNVDGSPYDSKRVEKAWLYKNDTDINFLNCFGRPFTKNKELASKRYGFCAVNNIQDDSLC